MFYLQMPVEGAGGHVLKDDLDPRMPVCAVIDPITVMNTLSA